MRRAFLFGCVLAALAVSATGQVIKFGTVAPEGSPWHEAMKEMGEEWGRISNGKIRLRIYPGGVAGDEPDMLRKMRIGQLHAAALTSIGMIDVVPDIEALSFPLEVRTDGEIDYVVEQVGPVLEPQIEAKGFKVLAWSTAGWVHFFAREPVVTPDDMRKQKLFFWGSDTGYQEALKRLRFTVVPLAVTDLMTSLQTGLVDAFATPPAAALAFQWFGLAPNMTALNWQPMPGVVVITTKQWDRLPAALHPELQQAAREMGAKLQVDIRELEAEAIRVMQQHGLKIHDVPPDVEAEWQAIVKEHGYPLFVGKRFSRETFAQVQEALKTYRAQQASGAANPSEGKRVE